MIFYSLISNIFLVESNLCSSLNVLKQNLLFSYFLFYVRIIKYFIFIVWLCPFSSRIFAGTPYVLPFLFITTFIHAISQKYQLIKL